DSMTSNKPTIATESASPTAMGAWRTWRSWQYRGGLGQHILTFYGAQGFGRWLGREFWAVTDQGLFAVSNFALNVLLARWLAPQDYGAFAVAFAVFLLLGTFHSSLLIEPMLVFGPGRYRRRLSEYVGVLLYGHSGFAVLGSLVLLLACVGGRLAGAGVLSEWRGRCGVVVLGVF